MKTGSILVCLSVVACAGGCRQAEPEENTFVTEQVPVVLSDTLTLSTEQLMALDWSGRSTSGAKVVHKHAGEGSGVVFDIRFPGNKSWQNSINYVSSGAGGRMELVGLDVAPFQSLALKFTLVSIDGAVGPTLGQQLVVGAVAGPTADGKLSQYEPVVLSFAGDQTGIARTPVGTPWLREVGIHVHLANPEAWSEEGALVRLLVEPISTAAPLPPRPVIEEEQPRPKPANLPDFGPGRTGAW
ncbi:MAG: hypothetical protein JW993_19720 [Sedimentisphaerales bacterium]|nr:hypothetical protein [Sedimentisphaerales bacterium]